jgi:glyoxylase-like metal-dependent hydrolase (beta-lactamase superfamily II)
MVEVLLSRVGYTRKWAWLANRSSWFGSITFPAMIAVIRHPRLGTILFDCGYGRALEDAPSAKAYRRLLPFVLPDRERLPARLARMGVSQVDMIYLSHFHPDHIGGLREVPGNPPILCSRDGLARLRSLKGFPLRRAAFFAELLPDDFERRARAIEGLPRMMLEKDMGEGYDVAGDGSLIAVELQGHAAGQYGLMCRLGDGRCIFLCADAAWLSANFMDGACVPAWPVRFLVDDFRAFNSSLAWLREFSLRCPDVRVIPSHCENSIAAYGQQD